MSRNDHAYRRDAVMVVHASHQRLASYCGKSRGIPTLIIVDHLTDRYCVPANVMETSSTGRLDMDDELAGMYARSC